MADANMQASYSQNKQDLSLVQGALRLSIPVLTKYPHQIAAQLTGRLLTQESQGVQRLLSQIRRIQRGLTGRWPQRSGAATAAAFRGCALFAHLALRVSLRPKFPS